MALSKMGEKRQRKWKREAWVKEGNNFFTKLPQQNNQKKIALFKNGAKQNG